MVNINRMGRRKLSTMNMVVVVLLGMAAQMGCGVATLRNRQGNWKPEVLEDYLENEGKRLLADDWLQPTWHKFNLELDVEDLKKYFGENMVERSDIAIVELQKLKSYMNTFFTVYFAPRLKFGNVKCVESRYEISKKYLADVDFYLKAIPEDNKDDPNIAGSAKCMVEKSGRAVVGLIFLNMPRMTQEGLGPNDLFMRILHEFTHLLGFSGDVFADFPASTPTGDKGSIGVDLNFIAGGTEPVPVRPDGRNTEVLGAAGQGGGSRGNAIEEVMQKVKGLNRDNILRAFREVSGCNEFEGVPLSAASEGLGSQWHYAWFAGEYMSSVATTNQRISRVTIEALLATGWYRVETGGEMEAHQEWGFYDESDGCSVKAIPPAGNSYCEVELDGEMECARDRRSASICKRVEARGVLAMEGGLPIEAVPRVPNHLVCGGKERLKSTGPDPANPTGPPLETEVEFGSLCVEGNKGLADSLNEAMCVPARCSADKLLIEYYYKDVFSTCTPGQPKVLPDNFTLQCPTIQSVCPDTPPPACPDYCKANGLCMANHKCFCFFGLDETGPSCKEYKEEESKFGGLLQLPFGSLFVLTACLLLYVF
jgi:hypothetical protein